VQSPIQCNQGQYLINRNSTTIKQTCAVCPLGSFKDTVDGDGCIVQPVAACPLGQWLLNSGSNVAAQACVACPGGTYQDQPLATDSNSCIPQPGVVCAPGHDIVGLLSVDAARRCAACAGGFYNPDTLTAKPTCTVRAFGHNVALEDVIGYPTHVRLKQTCV
jgi:hypothetical protein